MSYIIHIDYRDGDTDRTFDKSCDLPFEWENKWIAKVALARIKEHYNWFECDARRGRISGCFKHWNEKCPEEPEWHKKMGILDHPSMKDYYISLPMDDGSEKLYHAEWCGHFEHLQAGQILEKPDEGMSFHV